ncbi:hypothetical protein EX30DRAFT_352102 [Ascodesmis nigricans]|uniref:Uncharacterized protein n=1 Tax=Ascodesmis nigricans TaxID=341454 RepID=A0A4S2MJI3_9PEZI|nr:hypothetical protein EX30DRAFT_352102 [Ascodesmis nigricans]
MKVPIHTLSPANLRLVQATPAVEGFRTMTYPGLSTPLTTVIPDVLISHATLIFLGLRSDYASKLFADFTRLSQTTSCSIDFSTFVKTQVVVTYIACYEFHPEPGRTALEVMGFRREFLEKRDPELRGLKSYGDVGFGAAVRYWALDTIENRWTWVSTLDKALCGMKL